MVHRDFVITVLFVLLGAALWLVSGYYTAELWIRWALLIGVGVIIPTILTSGET
ncbi:MULTISPECIES: hypothetical protein [Haloferax]|uniref:Uncharacterized protein n=1 Tax=Haloferax mediterranei (strain ATCC 33500 / DSM 1411 / JCM 8866 / NBRC 14739 / NCIMB 2177 / R-4) TaxID=523841 RepID=I3R192_HALMT|nr:hypothetical protein [Haloferax mediterranei]AFK18002.1 hypothetical protein HFX_0261 [Haloferax mediterranei ATCC 33500]EMA02722.1 hypothetical protein C439_09065 [Haloferax mediterranei ATCC 33500]MDX5988094.1 hypothetical protein [Haloferax mediterranei ATCC 33500]